MTVLLLQPWIAGPLGLPALIGTLAFPYQLCIGTLVAGLFCAIPRGPPANSSTIAMPE